MKAAIAWMQRNAVKKNSFDSITLFRNPDEKAV
jgi:hypothetical protein